MPRIAVYSFLAFWLFVAGKSFISSTISSEINPLTRRASASVLGSLDSPWIVASLHLTSVSYAYLHSSSVPEFCDVVNIGSVFPLYYCMAHVHSIMLLLNNNTHTCTINIYLFMCTYNLYTLLLTKIHYQRLGWLMTLYLLAEGKYICIYIGISKTVFCFLQLDSTALVHTCISECLFGGPTHISILLMNNIKAYLITVLIVIIACMHELYTCIHVMTVLYGTTHLCLRHKCVLLIS